MIARGYANKGISLLEILRIKIQNNKSKKTPFT